MNSFIIFLFILMLFIIYVKLRQIFQCLITDFRVTVVNLDDSTNGGQACTHEMALALVSNHFIRPCVP